MNKIIAAVQYSFFMDATITIEFHNNSKVDVIVTDYDEFGIWTDIFYVPWTGIKSAS